MVVSTQCRSCRTNIQVRDGKAVSRPRPMARLASPYREASQPAPESRRPVPAKPFKLRKQLGPALEPILRFFLREKPPREVICFCCGHTFKAIREAHSSQCPKCSGYVSLRDYEIDHAWNRRIQTRGNVVILKNGSVSGITIQCHHLTVLGKLAGSVECSGDLVIRSHGKILGQVHCRELRVERGARVEFLSPVLAERVRIDGNVRGQITSNGLIILEKRARLQGLVRAAGLTVKPGAKHIGTIEIIQAPVE
jgi:cytoskeletal protein CcmA (bactofilin family)